MPIFRTLGLTLTALCAIFLSGDQQKRRNEMPLIQFVDVAAKAGVARVYTTHSKPNTPLTILQTIGHGGAFLDYNNDGNLDILLVDSKLTLFEGDGSGHFKDVTHAVGIDKLSGHFLGCAVGDYDNDGYEDVYISGYHTGLLLHNEGQGKDSKRTTQGRLFRDVTQTAGLKPQPWGSSCGFVDLDGDGKLDLVVANYVEYGFDSKKYLQVCVPLACPPQDYRPERPSCYRNLGNGRFQDVTPESGMKTAAGKGLGIAFADYDNDGKEDILFANDEVEGDLFHNEGNFHFTNQGVAAGVAYGPEGRVHGGMGADWADYDGDGKPDALVATYANQPKSLYRNSGQGLFTDASLESGVGQSTQPYVAFGIKWLDYDNDGWPDLMIANGNVDNNIHILFDDQHYRQPTQLLRNLGGKAEAGRVRFADVSQQAGEALRRPVVGRGLATGDFDNDGRMDALLIEDEGPVMLLHNEGGKTGNWVGLSLEGSGRSNRDAIGAKVTLTAGGHTQVREVQVAGSYLSSSDRRLVFGLGTATQIQRLTIRWPDGREQELPPPAIGKYHVVRETMDTAVSSTSPSKAR